MRSIASVSISQNFFVDIIQKAVIIGMGSWSGTILCSPTVLGTTIGILHQQTKTEDDAAAKEIDTPGHSHSRSRTRSDQIFGDTILFF